MLKPRASATGSMKVFLCRFSASAAKKASMSDNFLITHLRVGNPALLAASSL